MKNSGTMRARKGGAMHIFSNSSGRLRKSVRVTVAVATAVAAVLGPAGTTTADPVSGKSQSVGASANIVTGPYRLLNSASRACLDQDYTDDVPHERVLAFECFGTNNQQWYRERLPSGAFKLINRASRACLDQDYTDDVPHERVLAFTCYAGAANQEWWPWQYGDGSWRLTNRASGACLDQDYTDDVPHERVLAFECFGTYNQRWYMTLVP
jgi:hypothetical protein